MCCRLAVNETAAAAASLPLRRDSLHPPPLFPPAISTSPVLSVLFVSSRSFFYLREVLQNARAGVEEGVGSESLSADSHLSAAFSAKKRRHKHANKLEHAAPKCTLTQKLSMQTHFSDVYFLTFILDCYLTKFAIIIIIIIISIFNY